MSIDLKFSALLPYWPMIAKGILSTVVLATTTILLGFLLGSLIAVGRRSSLGAVRRLCSVYVEAVRNTPLLIQIFLVYFGFATLSLRLDAFVVAIIALALNCAAYTSEIVRAGIDSINKGQWEAAAALGLSKLQTYLHVIFVPAIQNVYPSLTSQFILLMLASSVVSQISVEELTAVSNYVQSETFRPFETFLVAAGVYLGLSAMLRVGFWALSKAFFRRHAKQYADLKG